MLGTLALLLLATAAADPRPDLIQLQMDGRLKEALGRTERELADHPSESRALGLDYLRGHLLDRLGDDSASEAFIAALATAPPLRLYSRYRLALAHEQRNHPEVAAGLIATGLGAADLRSPLLPDAVRLLSRTVDRGGDCRLLQNLPILRMPEAERRILTLSMARCAKREQTPDKARRLLITLLAERRDDETARSAADELAGLVDGNARGREPMLVGLTFHEHGDFERALGFLAPLRIGTLLASHEAVEAQYAFSRCHLSLRSFRLAAVAFGELARSVRTPAVQARAYFQQGRSLQLSGSWLAAAASFQQASRVDPSGERAAPALAAALGAEWRLGREAAGLDLYQRLLSDPRFAGEARRAALFLAVSDLVRGRRDRAERWLTEAAGDRGLARDISYWRGRAAELAGKPDRAVRAYAEVLRGEPLQPLAQAALARLGDESLAPAATSLGKRLAESSRLADLYAASRLLPADDPAQRAVRTRLRGELVRDPRAAAYLRLRALPVAQWPLWNEEIDSPEEILLALGVWPEAAPAVAAHFPLSSPALAFTGARLLAGNDQIAASVEIAEGLRERMPATLTNDLLPRPFQQLLYPLPLRETVLLESRQRKLDPALLAAVVRAEVFSSRPGRAAALRRLARSGLSPEAYVDGVGAALELALREAGGNPHLALAALAAGANEAALARVLCFSAEPAELLAKLPDGARLYVESVLTDAAYYRRLYSW